MKFPADSGYPGDSIRTYRYWTTVSIYIFLRWIRCGNAAKVLNIRPVTEYISRKDSISSQK